MGQAAFGVIKAEKLVEYARLVSACVYIFKLSGDLAGEAFISLAVRSQEPFEVIRI